MKRIFFRCLPWLLVSTALLAESPDAADHRVLVDLTRRYDAASAAGDGAAVSGFLHPTYVHTAPDGQVRDAAGQRAFIQARGVILASPRNDDINVARYGNVAVATERFSATRDDGGKSVPVSERVTLVWAKEADGWRLVAEQRGLAIAAPASDSLASIAAPSVGASATGVVSSSARPPAAVVADQGSVSSTASPSAPGTSPAPATFDAESRQRSGLLPVRVRQLIRAYEPNQVGYTVNQGDDSFLDFTFSLMLPLYGPAYPPPYRNTSHDGIFRDLHYASPGLYFAHTQRAGQYIGTRSSSPVVGKRFNPLLSLRFWATGADGEKESEDNFLEVMYGHESNGQFLSSPEGFNNQLAVYLNEATTVADTAAIAEARRSTRDNISRGWDYIGAQFARDWDANWVLPWDKSSSSTLSVRGKFNYFLKEGLAQGDAEQYNAWENDPEGKARKYVDGISVRLSMTVGPKTINPGHFGLERRYALTWTTGYADPLRYNTFKAEAGVMAFGLPLMLWYRTGYNSDLIDYYKRDHSFGATLSFWKY